MIFMHSYDFMFWGFFYVADIILLNALEGIFIVNKLFEQSKLIIFKCNQIICYIRSTQAFQTEIFSIGRNYSLQ